MPRFAQVDTNLVRAARFEPQFEHHFYGVNCALANPLMSLATLAAALNSHHMAIGQHIRAQWR